MEQLISDVKALATREGRMVGTIGHDEARVYILGRLREVGAEHYSGERFDLPYESSSEGFVNIVGRIPVTDSQLDPILVGAHYDTCGRFSGADDNAAAVAVLLEFAEGLKVADLNRDVILAFFDAEEPPHFLGPSMGSIRFYEDQRLEEIHCAIIMDLVGHDVPVPGLEDLIFLTGAESDPDLPVIIKDAEPTSNLRSVPILNSYVGDLSDHHIFRTNERPYLLLTCGRWDHYHMASDTPEKLNYEKMAAVVPYLNDLVERISKSEMRGPSEAIDTTEIELYFLRKNVLPTLLDGFGLNLDLNTRSDIDQLVRMMTSQFEL